MTGIGEKLRKARLEQGITFEDVVKDTKIRSRYLQALEEEEWDVFPGTVYLRGFLRSYSSYLGLNDAEMLKKLQEIPLLEPEIAMHMPQKLEFPGKPRRKLSVIYGIIALLLLVGFQYAYKHFLNQPVPPPPTNNAVGEKPSPDIPDSKEKPEESLAAESDSFSLRLQVLEGRCWVRVSAENAIIYEDTLKAGEEKEFDNLQNVTFTLGNPGGVRVFLNGEDYGTMGRAGVAVTKKYALQDKKLVDLST